ncbi:MAG: alkaline phosphatase family protein, partial [Deltaproteobacteria bacterium]|nr:alkaline phosphatase family protein [Deltaproteobacteria bacterium]
LLDTVGMRGERRRHTITGAMKNLLPPRPRPMPSLSRSLGLGLLLLVVACSREVPERRPRVVILGLDGASPRVIEPMLEAGRLPNLAKLAASGAYGPLKSHHPLLSPRVWTSMATGKRPKRHGIKSWVTPVGDGRNRLLYGSDRQTAALWNIVSQAGLRVGIVNWLMTYPPEVVDGVLISDHAIPAEAKGKKFLVKTFSGGDESRVAPIRTGGALTYPPGWISRALDDRHLEATLTDIPDPFAGNAALPFQRRIRMLSQFYARDQQLASMTLEIETEIHPDLLMVIFQGIDRVSHFLWEGVETDLPEGADRAFSQSEAAAARIALERYYEYSDALVGRFLEHFDENDLVLVVSDHGFEHRTGQWRTGNHTTPAAEDGIIIARGPSVAPGRISGVGVDDITPLVLAALGLPIGEDMDGRVPDFHRGAPVVSVPTHDVETIVRLDGEDSGADAMIEAQLRALGYVE